MYCHQKGSNGSRLHLKFCKAACKALGPAQAGRTYCCSRITATAAAAATAGETKITVCMNGLCIPVESFPEGLTGPPKHPTAGVPSASQGRLSALLRLPITTELAGTPVTLAMQLARGREGVLSAVPPQMEMLAFSTWHTPGAGAGAGATGKRGGDWGTVTAVGEGTGKEAVGVGVNAAGAGAGA